MKLRIYYLLPLLLLLVACSKRKEEKKLYPTKVLAGDTQYDFHYSRGKIYSVTITQPKYYGTFIYRYYDEYFKKPEHPLKDYIFEINYDPDHNIIGWDGRDSIISKSIMVFRNTNPELPSTEHQFALLYIRATSPEDTVSDRRQSYSDEVKHTYNKKNQLVESEFFIKSDINNINYSAGIPAKRVVYAYNQGKLAKASYYDVDADKPYQVIEIEYDDKVGYLKNLPLEARFMPLELPYRNHNIISYKVMDGQGKIRKDLSYTCAYTYNRLGYPNTFTQKMFDGRETKGYMVYKAVTKVQKMIAAK